MRLEAIDSETGKLIFLEAENLTVQNIEELNSTEIPESLLKSSIDNLNISADAKSMLYRITYITVKAGNIIIKLGKKILDIVISLFNSFPEAGFGLILGAILGILIGTIPVVGAVLGSTAIALLTALGFTLGIKEDIHNKSLAREIAKANKKFDGIKGQLNA